MFLQRVWHTLQNTADDEIKSNMEKKRRQIKQLKHDAFIKAAGSIAVLAVTFTLVFGITYVPTNDMYPAVHKGDLIIYFRPGRIVNTDVVLYSAPDGNPQIGRVKGTEGETVGKSAGGLLTINDNIQPVQEKTGVYEETFAGSKDISGEIRSEEYLILGDHREEANDSRTFGLIPRKAIKGKVFIIIRRRPL